MATRKCKGFAHESRATLKLALGLVRSFHKFVQLAFLMLKPTLLPTKALQESSQVLLGPVSVAMAGHLGKLELDAVVMATTVCVCIQDNVDERLSHVETG